MQIPEQANDHETMSDPTVWVPDHMPWAEPRGARINISDRPMRMLVMHHLAQAGTMQEAPCHASIELLAIGEPPQPHRVYIAGSNTDICEFSALAELAAPIGLAAIADLDDLPTIVTGVLGGVTSQGAVAAAVLAAARSMSRRSLEVLELVARGHTNMEISRELNFSLTTIKRDLMDLFDVFDSRSRRELVRKAAEAGLVAQPWGHIARQPAAPQTISL